MYDGSTDPEDFLQQFEHAVKTQHWDNLTACHMFPGQLQSVAREWFAKLPALSITSFTDLRTKFVQRFQNFKCTELTHLDAHNINMRPRESLMNFTTRFTAECQKIPDLSELQQISAYITGICQTRHLSLVKTMRCKLPKMYVEAVKMVRDYVRSEEFADAVIGDHRSTERSDKMTRVIAKEMQVISTKEAAAEEAEATDTLAISPKIVTATVRMNDKGHDADDCKELKKVIVERLKLGEFDHLKPSRVKTPGMKEFAWQRGKEKALEKHIHMIQMWHSGHVRKAEVLEEWECAPITLPAFWRVCPTDLPITITATVGRCKVSIIYVDTSSAVDVLYEHCFLQLPQDVQDRMKPPLHPVAGFTSETTWPLGRVDIDVTLEENKKRRTVALNFVVVRSQSKYNIIMGREALFEFGAIVSTVHGMMKFPTPLGVVTVFSYRVPIVGQVEQPQQQAAPVEQGEIINHYFPEKVVQIGNTLSNEMKNALCELLANNADVFAWQESDMTGVPRTIAEHRLNANPSLTPVRQKK
ncbi:uncharacterized protein [Rutidosis leptorrhynchoides]|uniref:uncharacterized protein n=1 Tax=Rutidosis leptorrhynchoides TaxID=125765 RepID=UPI003A99D9A2